MEEPGMSLFQGAASIHINNSAQDRLEEQEELEDQKRRNEELKHKLANAFDDLLDDDEASSVNSSGNFTLHPGQSNGGERLARTGLPPTYVESLNGSDAPKAHCDLQNNHSTPVLRHQDDVLTIPYSPMLPSGVNYFPQNYGGHLNGINNIESKQDYMNNEKLKVMYEMRVKECQQLAGQMEKLDTEVDSLRMRLAAAVSDKDKAELSLQDAHHLLASSKHKLIELEQQVTSLTEKLVENDQEKEQLKLEVRSATISLQDVQQRFHTLQVAHTHDTDALFKGEQDRHREEMDRLQDNLTKTRNRLSKKENEIKILEKRCMEKDREREDILIEKGSTINRLASELEIAQSRLISGETVKLKEKVSQLNADRNAAREQVKELGSKLEETAHELVLYRNKLAANQKEYENWRSRLHQIVIESLPDNTFIGEPPSPGYLLEFKEALSGYKHQMQKITKIEDEITKRDKMLEFHGKRETELQAKVDELKKIEMQLTSRLIVLQKQVDTMETINKNEIVENYKKDNDRLQKEIADARTEIRKLELKRTKLEMVFTEMKSEKGCQTSMMQEANADLARELDRYTEQLNETLKENGELKTLYLQACSSRETVSRELKNIQALMKNEKELFESQKTDYLGKIETDKQQIQKLNTDLSSCREDLERANKWISELQKEFSDKQKDFNEKLDKFIADEKSALRQEIESCIQCQKHLKQTLVLEDKLEECKAELASQESNQVVIKELRGKADFFMKYIMDRSRKLGALCTVGTNTDDNRDPSLENVSIAQLVQECDDSYSTRNVLMEKEKIIREQLAKKFTLEIKTMELNCARKTKEMEDEHLITITKLKELLRRKRTEVESMKELILMERAKTVKMLELKENEISVLIKEHNELQAEYQKAKDSEEVWKHKAERYKGSVSKLSSLEDALKNEKEQEHVRESKIAKLKAKLTQIEQKYDKIQTEQLTLQEKYKNVKKTVVTYKDYISKKDAHINNEMNRIQDEYRKIFDKLQNELNFHVNCRIQEERKIKKGKPTEAQPLQQFDYTEKMKKLNEDFAKLAQSTFKDPETNSQ